MTIYSLLSLPEASTSIAKRLWEENMQEPWTDYDNTDMFVVLDKGEYVGGFALYRDKSDGISGIFCSGWAGRHKKVPCDRIIKQITRNVGDVYFKTNKRAAKFLLEKIGKKVKMTDQFGYYIVRGEKNGTTK